MKSDMRRLESTITKKLRWIMGPNTREMPNVWVREQCKIITIESHLRIRRIQLFRSILNFSGNLVDSDSELPALLYGNGPTEETQQIDERGNLLATANPWLTQFVADVHMAQARGALGALPSDFREWKDADGFQRSLKKLRTWRTHSKEDHQTSAPIQGPRLPCIGLATSAIACS